MLQRPRAITVLIVFGFLAAFVGKLPAQTPTISSISPTHGHAGDQVSITGTQFGSVIGPNGFVRFGNVNATVVSWSDTQVVVTVPSTASSGGIRVSQNNVFSNTVNFTFDPSNITAINPTHGYAGDQVTITGTQFGSVIGPNGFVRFGNVNATVASWNDTQVVVTVPSTASSGGIRVSQNSVFSNTVNFTFDPSNITAISPTHGYAGDQVTITGTKFGSVIGPNGFVRFGSVNATVVSWSDTQVVVTVPSTTTSGGIRVSQNSVFSNTVNYTFDPSTVTTASPSSAAVGAQVVITGTKFGAAQGSNGLVQFGSTYASVVSWSDSQIVAAVPSGTSGTLRVDQSGVWSNTISFTTLPTPSISSLAPSSGSSGTNVTITGSNLGTSQGTVTFNGVQATPTSWNTNSITVPVPNGATTGNVVVTASGVNTSGLPFTVPTPALSQLSPTAGSSGTLVTLTGSNFGSTQGSSQALISGLPVSVVTWSNSTITANIPSGVTAGQQLPVTVVTSAGTSNQVEFFIYAPPATGATLTPVKASMLVGETRTFQALDSSGVALTGEQWTSSDTNVVSLSTDDPPIVTALAPGEVTLTVGDATANITVYEGVTLPTNTVKWEVPGDGSGVNQITPAVPSSEGVADVFGFQNSGKVAAITSDGLIAWSADVSAYPTRVPDFQGGLVLANTQNVKKLDGITGQAYPAYVFTATPPVNPDVLVHTDGTIFVIDGNAIVGINSKTGQTKFRVQPQETSYTDGGSGNCGEYVPVPRTNPAIIGPGIIAGDGYAYFSYSYGMSTATKICNSDGSESASSHDEQHIRALRIGTDGSPMEIVLGDGQQDISSSCDSASGGSGECPHQLSYSKTSSWSGAGGGTFITNADQGVVYSSRACPIWDDPNSCTARDRKSVV